MKYVMKLLYCAVYIAILGVVAHFFGEALPREKFDPQKFPYKQFFWEDSGKFYKMIGVKRWKTKVPDASKHFKDMVPKRLEGMSSKEVETLIGETCVAEFVHVLLCVFSGGVCLIWRGKMGYLLWAICAAVNLVFVIIQRYNRPILIRLAEKLKIREEKLKICES